MEAFHRFRRQEDADGFRNQLSNRRRALNVDLDDHILTAVQGSQNWISRYAISVLVDRGVL